MSGFTSALTDFGNGIDILGSELGVSPEILGGVDASIDAIKADATGENVAIALASFAIATAGVILVGPEVLAAGVATIVGEEALAGTAAVLNEIIAADVPALFSVTSGEQIVSEASSALGAIVAGSAISNVASHVISFFASSPTSLPAVTTPVAPTNMTTPPVSPDNTTPPASTDTGPTANTGPIAPTPTTTGFVGDKVTLTHYYPVIDPAQARNQGTAIVSDSSVEFPDLSALPLVTPNPPGNTTAPRSYDFNDSTVTITYPEAITSLPGSADVITTDPSDAAITGVTVDASTTVPGFTQGSVSSSAHEIDLNYSNISATAGEKIVLDVTFAPSSTSSTATTTAAANDPTITQSGATISGDSSETYNVTGNNFSENIGITNTSPVFINGNADSLSLSAATSSFAITDNGQGTTIDLTGIMLSAGAMITLNNFQNDATGAIILPNQYASASAAVAALQSDGQGGSVLPLSNGASLHFVGDNKLTAASFAVGHA